MIIENTNQQQFWNQVFRNEVPLPNNFNITEVYNPNRESAYYYKMCFIEECFKAGLFDIHKFEINTALLTDTDQRKKRNEIERLKEYHRENNFIIESLWNLIQAINQTGIDVLEGGDSISPYVRAYVPALKLMISPSTQNITGFLHTLTQKDEQNCIVSHEYESFGEDEKTVAYIIKTKPQFHKAYNAFKLKEIEIYQNMVLKFH